MSTNGPHLHRRAVLAGTAVGILSLAGCIDSGASVGNPDEERATSRTSTTTQSTTDSSSDSDVIEFAELSSAAQQEVRTAIEQGSYSTCETLALRDEIDLDANPRIAYNGTTYQPAVRVGSGNSEECGTKYILTTEPVSESTSTPADRTVVAFEDLPPEAQTEVKTAIQNGRYSECGSLALEQAIDLQADPLIKYEGALYEPALIVGGAGKQEDECATHILQMDVVDGTTTAG